MSYFIALNNTNVKLADIRVRRDGSIDVDVAKTIFAIFSADTIDNISDEIGELGGSPAKAQLIVDNNAVTYKDLRIPSLDRKKTAQIVYHEMLSTATRQDLLTAWMNIGEEKDAEGLVRVLGCAIPEPILTSYLPLFHNIGCRRPRGIDVGCHALLEYLRHSSLRKTRSPYLAAEISTGYLRLFLFDENCLVVVRNVRVQTDDSESLIRSIREQVSQLQQFQSARRRDSRISDVYLFGDLNGMEYLAEHCGQDSALSFACLPPLRDINAPDDFNYLAYVYLLGSAVSARQEVDLYAVEKAAGKARHGMDHSLRTMLIVLLAILIPLGLLEGYELLRNASLKRQIKAEQEYITDPERLGKLQTVANQQNEISLYDDVYSQLNQTYTINDIYLPTITSGLVIPFYRYAGVQVQSFQYDSTNITVSCTASDVNAPYNYVNFLQSTNLYEKVEYTGFQKSAADSSKTQYVFTVTAVLYRGQ